MLADRVVFGNVDPSSSEVFRSGQMGWGGESADVVGDGSVEDCSRGLFVGGGRAGGVAGALRGAPRHQVKVGPIGRLSGGPSLEEPPIPVAIGLVKNAVSRVRAGKAAGLSGVVVRMVGATGSAGAAMIRGPAVAVRSQLRMGQGIIVCLCKGGSDALDRGNYGRLALKEWAMGVVGDC